MTNFFTFHARQLSWQQLQKLCSTLENKPSKIIGDICKASSITAVEFDILSDYAASFPGHNSVYLSQDTGEPTFSSFPPTTLVVVKHDAFLFEGRYTTLTFWRAAPDAYRVEWKRGEHTRVADIVRVTEDQYLSKLDGTRAKLKTGDFAVYFQVQCSTGTVVVSGYQLSAASPGEAYKRFQPTLFSDALYHS